MPSSTFFLLFHFIFYFLFFFLQFLVSLITSIRSSEIRSLKCICVCVCVLCTLEGERLRLRRLSANGDDFFPCNFACTRSRSRIHWRREKEKSLSLSLSHRCRWTLFTFYIFRFYHLSFVSPSRFIDRRQRRRWRAMDLVYLVQTDTARAYRIDTHISYNFALFCLFYFFRLNCVECIAACTIGAHHLAEWQL